MHAYYFGVESPRHLGHYWHEGVLTEHGSARWDLLRRRDPETGRDCFMEKPPGFPWDKWDGAFHTSQREGHAELHHKDGWTVLAFEDRSADNRPRSNSVFAFDEELTFGDAMVSAKLRFPWIWDRIKFDVVPYAAVR